MNMPPPPPPSGYPGWNPGQAGGWSQHPGGQQVREHPDGTTVLVLGILGLVVCGILAPFAWVKGSRAKSEIDAQPHVQWSNRGSVTAGRILGIIGTVIMILWVALFLVVILAIAGGSTT